MTPTLGTSKKRNKRLLSMSELHSAAMAGDGAKVQALIESGADVNVRDDKGRTPLRVAALCGRTEVWLLLLRKGGRE